MQLGYRDEAGLKGFNAPKKAGQLPASTNFNIAVAAGKIGGLANSF